MQVEGNKSIMRRIVDEIWDFLGTTKLLGQQGVVPYMARAGS